MSPLEQITLIGNKSVTEVATRDLTKEKSTREVASLEKENIKKLLTIRENRLGGQ